MILLPPISTLFPYTTLFRSGYHRLFTHRAFESSRWFKAVVAVLGSMAVEGSVIVWVADHRKHHAFTDQEGRSEEHTSELQSHSDLVCRLLLEKKKSIVEIIH